MDPMGFNNFAKILVELVRSNSSVDRNEELVYVGEFFEFIVWFSIVDLKDKIICVYVKFEIDELLETIWEHNKEREKFIHCRW
jgi:hypothetical protein